MVRHFKRWIIGTGIGIAGVALVIAHSTPDPSLDESPSKAPGAGDESQVVIDNDALHAAPPQSESSSENSTPPAYRLATLNADVPLESGDPSVLRFRSLLRTTALQVPEREPEIADLTVRTWRALRNAYGIEIGLLALMESANRLVYSIEGSGMSYADLMPRLIAQWSGR